MSVFMIGNTAGEYHQFGNNLSWLKEGNAIS